MPRIRFHRNYDHRWPSRAVTAFKSGWEGSVKREVVAGAVPGYAELLPTRRPDGDARDVH